MYQSGFTAFVQRRLDTGLKVSWGELSNCAPVESFASNLRGVWIAVFPNVSSKKRWIALDCLFFPSFCLVSVLYSQKWQSVILSAGFIRTIYRRLESSRW